VIREIVTDALLAPATLTVPATRSFAIAFPENARRESAGECASGAKISFRYTSSLGPQNLLRAVVRC
jgi:hypothetical protein